MRLLPGLVLAVTPLALSCGPLTSRQTDTNSSNPLTTGSDDPADPATLGYFTNHVSLNTNNLTRSLDFYTRVLGMRHMFTYQLTPELSFTYMGHSQGGRNGTGYQTTQELIRMKQNSAGLIELVYFNTGDPGQQPITGPDQRTSTFSHLGVIVPDPVETQKRLEEYGVTIYKKIGDPWPTEGALGTPYGFGDAAGLSEEGWENIRNLMAQFNSLNIFAADPDGNLLEIQPFNEPAIFG